MKLRVTLLCIVLIARNCHFVVEHPFQTLISRHRRWEWFCNQVCWVTWVKFKKMQLPSSTWDLLGIYITYVTIGFEGLEIFLTYPPPEVLPISGLEGPILADALWGSHTKAKCPFQQLQVDPGCWPWATYQSCSGGTDPVQNHPLEPQQWQLQKYNIYIYIYCHPRFLHVYPRSDHFQRWKRTIYWNFGIEEDCVPPSFVNLFSFWILLAYAHAMLTAKQLHILGATPQHFAKSFWSATRVVNHFNHVWDKHARWTHQCQTEQSLIEWT